MKELSNHFLNSNYFFTILLSIFSMYSFAQNNIGTYIVKVSGQGIEYRHASCEKELFIELTYNDNLSDKIVELEWFPTEEYFDINNGNGTPILATRRIIKMKFWSTRGYNDCWIKNCCYSKSGETTKNISFPYNCTIFDSSETNYRTCGEGLSRDYITITVLPKLTITTPSGGDLPSENKIKLESHIGFAPNEYLWQYSTDASNYINLPQFNGQSTIEVNAYDVLGSEMGKFVVEILQIQYFLR